MNGGWLRAAGAGRQCAPAALDRALLGGPSTSPLAVVMKVLWVSVGLVVLVTLGAPGWWWLHTPTYTASGLVFITEPGCLKRATVLVTLTQGSQICTVRTPSEGSSREIPCLEVGGYVRRILKPPQGTIVGIKAHTGVARDAATAVFNSLRAFGFEAGGSQCFVS